MLKIFQSSACLRIFTALVSPTGTARKKHDLTVNFCEVNTNNLAELELMQSTTQILSIAKVVIVLNGAKSSLDRTAKRAVRPIKPIELRRSTIAGFICF